jgi:hypothetical protein
LKTLLSLGIATIVMTSTVSTQASNSTKQLRNDRVTVTKNIHQYEINPFTDSKRVVRNDRVSYSLPQLERSTESVVADKHRYVRNDRVSIQK